MPLRPFNPLSPSHISVLVDTWNAACGADLAINSRLARYNTRPATGAIQAGRLAQHGDALIGFVLASALPNDPLTSPPEVGWVDAIAVLPEFQRLGIGSELLNWAEGWLVAQGCAAARLGGSLRPFVPGYPVELGSVAFFETRGYVERAIAPFVWDLSNVVARRRSRRSNLLIDFGRLLRGVYTERSARARNNISVRPARPSDQDALLDFLRREFPGRWRFEFEEFLRQQGQISNYQLLITDSAINGFARLNFEDSEQPIERVYMHRLPRPWGQLGPIGVSAAHRGRGMGAMLVNAALAEMKSRGVRGCVIDWTELLDFYKKFGFEPYRQYEVLTKSLAIRTAPATGS